MTDARLTDAELDEIEIRFNNHDCPEGHWGGDCVAAHRLVAEVRHLRALLKAIHDDGPPLHDGSCAWCGVIVDDTQPHGTLISGGPCPWPEIERE